MTKINNVNIVGLQTITEMKNNVDSLHVKRAFSQSQFTKHILNRVNKLGLIPGQPKVMEYLEFYSGCLQSDLCEAWILKNQHFMAFKYK